MKGKYETRDSNGTCSVYQQLIDIGTWKFFGQFSYKSVHKLGRHFYKTKSLFCPIWYIAR